MELRCAECGMKMIAPDNLVEGQHVRCPNCGAKSVFSRPRRIDLPLSVAESGQHRQPTPPISSGRPEAESRKPKIGLIRNPSNGPHVDLNAQRTAQMAEEKVREIEEEENRRREERQKRNFRNAVTNVLHTVALLAVILVGWFIYTQWQDRKAAEAKAAAEKVEQERIIARQKAESERLERERLAAEERERQREERERQKKERELERIAQEKRRAEERAQADREKAELVRQENETKENAAAYKGFLSALRENEFDLFLGGVTNAAARTNGMLCYFIETEERPVPLYIAEYSNGTVRVTCLTADGRRSDAGGLAQFQERLESLDYLVADENKTYYRARRKQCRTGRLSIQTDGDPAEAFFGSFAAQVRELNPVFEVLHFEIVFLPKGKQQKEIVCDNVEFGCTYSARKVREAVEEAFPCRPRRKYGKGAKAPKFKRTVKIWDGPQIKRGIDGITYVTRTFHSRSVPYDGTVAYGPGWGYCTSARRFWKNVHRNYENRETWEELIAQAKKEDAEEAQYYQDIRDRQFQEANEVSESVRSAWTARIDRMLEDGSLFYRIRKESVAKPSEK